MFYTKVKIWEDSIGIKAPTQPLIFILSYFFGSFVGTLVSYSLHGGVSTAEIAVTLLWICFFLPITLAILSYLHKKNDFHFIIDASGVTRTGKKGTVIFSLTWNEIRDFGFSSGSGTGISRYYCLYFADSVLTKSKRERVKKSKGHFTCITFDERTYLRKGPDILTFCKQFTDVTPFTADPEKNTGIF